MSESYIPDLSGYSIHLDCIFLKPGKNGKEFLHVKKMGSECYPFFKDCTNDVNA